MQVVMLNLLLNHSLIFFLLLLSILRSLSSFPLCKLCMLNLPLESPTNNFLCHYFRQAEFIRFSIVQVACLGASRMHNKGGDGVVRQRTSPKQTIDSFYPPEERPVVSFGVSFAPI